MKAKLTTRNLKLLQPKAKAYEVVDSDIKGFLLRIQPTGARTYYYSYRNQARKKVRYRIGDGRSLTPAQAREIAEQLTALIAMGDDVQARKVTAITETKQRTNNTLQYFIQQHYAPWLKPSNKNSARTLQSLHTDFKQFYALPLAELTVLTLEKWRAQTLARGLKASTINRKLSRLRSLLTKALEWNMIDVHPLIKLKRLKDDLDPILWRHS